jgi:hypothetical protein
MTGWRARLAAYRRPVLAIAGSVLVLAGTVGVAAAFAGGEGTVDGAAPAGERISASAQVPPAEDPLDSFELDRGKLGDELKTLCETYQSTLAARLGVSTDRLDAAMRDAAKAVVDKAVADGLISAERAAHLKEKIDKADRPICKALPPLPKPAAAPGQARKAILDPKALLDVAARTLGMTPDALAKEIRGLKRGEDMRALAKNHDVPYETLAKALREAARAQVDAAVKAERITRAQGEKVMAAFNRGLDRGRFLPKVLRPKDVASPAPSST